MNRRNYLPFLSLQDIDLLWSERFKVIGIGKLAEAILGDGFSSNNMACNPTAPASLSVNITPCELYELLNIDAAQYGNPGLPADTRPLVKQGINLDQTTLTFTVPSTAGDAVNYLIQAQVVETDTDAATRQFRDASGNQYTQSINQDRTDTVNLAIKAGTSAPVGSQVTPTPDPGFTGCFVVTITNGQTQITTSSIARYTSTNAVNFIDEKLQNKISQAFADARYVQKTVSQEGVLLYTSDTGAANSYAGTYTPPIASYNAGMDLALKISNTNTAPSTFNAGGGAASVKRIDGSLLKANDLLAGMIANFMFDGTNWQLKNPASQLALPNSIGVTGYCFLPNGLLLQWGNEMTVIPPNDYITVNFPIPFPNAAFMGVSNPNVSPTTGNYSTAMHIFSNSQFNLLNVMGAGIDTTYWFAIGN